MTALQSRPVTRFRPPTTLAASEPPEARGQARDSVRLLVSTPGKISHTRFRRLDRFLHAGDVLVVNNSATMPGQLNARRDEDPIVVHIANRLPDRTRVVELRSAPDAAAPILDGQAGEKIQLLTGGRVILLTPHPDEGSSPTGRGNRLWRAAVEVDGPVDGYLTRYARPISYGYLRGRFPIAHYQTVFALRPGSAEMPSAGRPFTPDLVTRLVARGVVFAPVTLHTSVSSQEVGEGPLTEWYDVPAQSARLINTARQAGRRVVAVGTTATRAVESAADHDGTVRPRSGWTDLVISAQRPIRTTSGLITGWHDPNASHLLLVEAVAGPDQTQRAYDSAADQHYHWHEFGDAGLFLP